MAARKSAKSRKSKPKPEPNVIADLLGEQATRSRILQGAATVFARKGVDATTVQDILRASGLSRRTFYKFFRGKDDVLQALFEILTQQAFETVRTAAVSDDPVERVTQTVDAYLSLWKSGGDLSFVLQTEAMRAGSPIFAIREKTMDAFAQQGATNYRKATGRAVDPLVFRSFQLALTGLLAHMNRDGRPTEQQYARVRRVTVSLIVRTMAAEFLQELPDLPAAEPTSHEEKSS